MQDHLTKRRIFILFVLMFSIAAYFACASIIQKMPYMKTQLSNVLRFWIIFPSLFFPFLWFSFLQKYETYKMRTIFQVQTSGTGLWKKVGHILMTICAAIFMFGAIAWSTIAIPGMLTKFFADKPYAQRYVVVDWTARAKGPTFYFDVDLIDPARKEKASFGVSSAGFDRSGAHESGFKMHKGSILCVEGRTSLFGTIVEKIGNCENLQIEL